MSFAKTRQTTGFLNVRLRAGQTSSSQAIDIYAASRSTKVFLSSGRSIFCGHWELPNKPTGVALKARESSPSRRLLRALCYYAERLFDQCYRAFNSALVVCLVTAEMR
jgi:hypothetical protein